MWLQGIEFGWPVRRVAAFQGNVKSSRQTFQIFHLFGRQTFSDKLNLRLVSTHKFAVVTAEVVVIWTGLQTRAVWVVPRLPTYQVLRLHEREGCTKVKRERAVLIEDK